MRWLALMLACFLALAGCSGGGGEDPDGVDPTAGPNPTGTAAPGTTPDPAETSGAAPSPTSGQSPVPTVTTGPTASPTASSPPSPTTSAPPPPPPPPPPAVHEASFQIPIGLLGLRQATFDPAQEGSDGNAFAWTVPAGATALLIEAQWSCSLPVCLVDWTVTPPVGEPEVAADAVSPLSWQAVGAPAAGTWTVQASAQLSALTTGDVRVTVFFAGGVPSGYTALPS